MSRDSQMNRDNQMSRAVWEARAMARDGGFRSVAEMVERRTKERRRAIDAELEALAKARAIRDRRESCRRVNSWIAHFDSIRFGI